MTRAIELVFRVQVLGVEAHLLQCDLDGDGSAVVPLGESARDCRVLGEDLSNLGCQAPRRRQCAPGDESLPGRWSVDALIFSQIENRFFAKMCVFGASRRRRKFELVSCGQSARAGPGRSVHKAFSSIPLLQKLDTLSLGFPLHTSCKGFHFSVLSIPFRLHKSHRTTL